MHACTSGGFSQACCFQACCENKQWGASCWSRSQAGGLLSGSRLWLVLHVALSPSLCLTGPPLHSLHMLRGARPDWAPPGSCFGCHNPHVRGSAQVRCTPAGSLFFCSHPFICSTVPCGQRVSVEVLIHSTQRAGLTGEQVLPPACVKVCAVLCCVRGCVLLVRTWCGCDSFRVSRLFFGAGGWGCWLGGISIVVGAGDAYCTACVGKCLPALWALSACHGLQKL